MRFLLFLTTAAFCSATPADAQPAERAAVIERVSQGVVRVRAAMPETRRSIPANKRGDQFDPFLESAVGSRRQEESGTGFVIDAAGHIVTASFVLDGAQTVFIALPSGEERPASVVAVDDVSSVAVLKADTEGLTPLSFSNAAPKRGEQVYTVAHAFGLPAALAASGVVAGADVDFPDEAQTFLVLDMSIKLGNAGAPVTNASGRVVGMATANYGSATASGSVGIAIPGDRVMDIAEKLIRDGRVERSVIGVGANPPGRGAAGAVIERVEEGSPAERAGLKPGDIVFTADGEMIADDRALARYIAARPVGSVVTLGYRRNGETREVALATVKQR